MEVSRNDTALYIQQRPLYASIIAALAETLAKRDQHIAGHSHLVQKNSLLIGGYLKLNERDMLRLEFASLLHDIGKIGIPDQVLKKDSLLTADEFEIMKAHPVFGADILKHIPGFEDVIPGVKHHHEYYDGSGYPDRLKGNEIDIIARTIAVADAFSVMVSGRPYRPKVSYPDAFAELRRCAGSQFDPEIVSTFIRFFPQRSGME